MVPGRAGHPSHEVAFGVGVRVHDGRDLPASVSGYQRADQASDATTAGAIGARYGKRQGPVIHVQIIPDTLSANVADHTGAEIRSEIHALDAGKRRDHRL
jgi:hypothetical protein